jgi:glycosyltransferase involved in cell wall biosynthesis
VLIVDYFFPPLGGAGVQRTLGYVRHLPDLGWQPTVLTVMSGDAPLHDPSLLATVPPTVLVHRAAALEPVRTGKAILAPPDAAGRPTRRRAPVHLVRRLGGLVPWVLFPDRHVGWLPFALREGVRLGHRYAFDVVYSTSTAVTSHLVACVLASAWRKPWVADFQDPFLERHPPFPSAAHRAAARRLEGLILRRAAHVTVTTGPLKAMFLNQHPSLSADKVSVITMGFEPEAFQGLAAVRRPKFSIAHFGNFYGPRSPGSFLTALGEAAAENAAFAREAEVRLFGNFAPEWRVLTDALVRRYGLDAIVRLEGTVPYTAGLAALLSSDVLLLVTEPGWTGQKLIPSKLFEYLAAGKPILALTPPGAPCDIVRAFGAGTVVPPDDVPAIRRALLIQYRLWREGRVLSRVDQDALKAFTWARLTRQMVAVLDTAMTRSVQHERM